MPPTAPIRLAVPADLPALVPLLDAYRVFYKKPSDPAAARAFMADRFANSDSILIVATRSDAPGTLTGFTQLYPSFSTTNFARTFTLADLYIAPEHRAQGIATQLLAFAATHAHSLGAIRLDLLTAVDNTPAKSLYESQGWQRTTTFDRYTLALPANT